MKIVTELSCKSHVRPGGTCYTGKNKNRRISMEILRIEDLCKTYDQGGHPVHALRNVAFSVEKGEFVAVIGQSGSGKSTLLHQIGGIDYPTSGHVYVDGVDIHTKNREELAIFRRRQVGLIYQFYNLIPVLTVEENITLPVRLDGQKVHRPRLEELLHILKLEDKAQSYPHQLSGGQQQRAAIGRALLYAPALLLADEPTGNLDTHNSQEIVEYFKQSNRKYKQTILLITHDDEIALQADRVIRLEDGRIVEDRRLRG